MTKLHKILGPTGAAIHGGTGRWHLPESGKPGKWMPAVANVVVCHHGYHLVTKVAVLNWLRCPAVIYEAEGRGDRDADDDGKTAFEQARLIRRAGRLTKETLVTWAADCAEHVLPIFERRFPDDARPREAIEAARAAADADDASVRAAAAARAAAYAARAAVYAAYAAAAADDAAARAAAYAAAAADDAAARAAAAAADAADDAVDDAAVAAAADADADAALSRTKERRWQADHLFRLMKTEA